MTNKKTKCICAQKGIICKRKLNLIKQGKTLEEVTSEDFICPLKKAIVQQAS